MTSNSTIFSSTVFGNSSSLTKEELIAKDMSTVELYMKEYSDSSMRTQIPRVPSNQRVAKDK